MAPTALTAARWKRSAGKSRTSSSSQEAGVTVAPNRNRNRNRNRDRIGIDQVRNRLG